MKALDKTEQGVEHVEEWLVIVLFSAMVVVVMAIVLCRYVFHIQFTMGEEIARYLMIWCGYSGAALGFRTHSHVGVVAFADMMPDAWQPVILKLRHVISSAILAVVFVVACICFQQYFINGSLTTATRLPMALVYVIVPISMALGVMHTVIEFAHDFTDPKPTDDEPTTVKERVEEEPQEKLEEVVENLEEVEES